ncbi:HGxxPAAW family protein [Acidipropionibacterium jensenii]|uniref:HGxxPAAW family protein n=1 Tax=Acidipropionibacterium jensenii TaxID=1749 RepID=UPI00214B006D|nr:HGxxPAAW family protein [Acidipropionibacterium jensenii]
MSRETATTVTARKGRTYPDGKSPAAWTGTAIAVVGFVIATVGAMAGPSWVLCIIGGALVAVAIVAVLVLKALGYGQSY